jgi:hypothetical protein
MSVNQVKLCLVDNIFYYFDVVDYNINIDVMYMESYKQFGGIITESEAFRHIKSIGYEFETTDLAKLSLEGDSYLINSSNNNADMDESQQFDKNYFTYGISLDLSDDPSETEFRESEESEESNVSVRTQKSTAENDNEYAEYMLEPRPKDGKNTKVAITNDIASHSFIKMLNRKCRGRENEKNALYMFRTHGGKIYNIKFDHYMAERPCATFSGLEVVITYYKPKRGNNLILNMFADACDRVISHLSNLKESRGDLFIANKNKKGFTAIGKIPYRKLFHKEGTNLYYLEKFDGASTNTRLQFQNIVFKPQMTFCVDVEHVYEVIKQIALPSTQRSGISDKLRMTLVHSAYVELMEKFTIPMVESYNDINTANGWKCEINMNTVFGRKMVNYLFLIYIKIDTYLLVYKKQTEEELDDTSISKNYFKNVLYMLVRHSNFELYSRMKYYMKKQFKKSEADTVSLLSVLMYNVDFLSTVMYSDKPEIFSKLNKSDPDYGDPKKSLESYFAFFENPIDPKSPDWLIHSETDGESTMYPLKEDDIIIENRFFNSAARQYYMNVLGKSMPMTDAFRLKQLIEVVAQVKGKSAKVMEMALTNKVLNPATGRLVAKCDHGKVRNDKFRCVTERAVAAKRARTRRSK